MASRRRATAPVVAAMDEEAPGLDLAALSLRQRHPIGRGDLFDPERPNTVAACGLSDQRKQSLAARRRLRNGRRPRSGRLARSNSPTATGAGSIASSSARRCALPAMPGPRCWPDGSWGPTASLTCFHRVSPPFAGGEGGGAVSTRVCMARSLGPQRHAQSTSVAVKRPLGYDPAEADARAASCLQGVPPGCRKSRRAWPARRKTRRDRASPSRPCSRSLCSGRPPGRPP